MSSVFSTQELPLSLLHRWGSPEVQIVDSAHVNITFGGQTFKNLAVEEDPQYKGQGKCGAVINFEGTDYRVQFLMS